MSQECPLCGTLDTRREWTDYRQDTIEVVYTCECGCQFAAIYGDPRIRVDFEGEP